MSLVCLQEENVINFALEGKIVAQGIHHKLKELCLKKLDKKCTCSAVICLGHLIQSKIMLSFFSCFK